jgi:hypothetical protein
MHPIVHTPGPWKVNYRRVTPVNAKQDGTDDICHVYGDESKEIANANLIAASPDMFRIIQRLATADWIGEAELNLWRKECRDIMRKVV